MIFIFGILLGLMCGLGAMATSGLLAVLLRKFGLLWGDRRVWVATLAIFTLLAGLDIEGLRDREPLTPGDHENAFDYCMAGGYAAGVLAVAGLLILLLIKWGRNWKPPHAVWSWVGSACFLAVAGVAGHSIHDSLYSRSQLSEESLQGIWKFAESKNGGRSEDPGEGVLHIDGNTGTWIFRDRETVSATFRINVHVDPTQIVWSYAGQPGGASSEVRQIVRMEGEELVFSASEDSSVFPTRFWSDSDGHVTTVYRLKD